MDGDASIGAGSGDIDPSWVTDKGWEGINKV